jgi:hypothetical protein
MCTFDFQKKYTIIPTVETGETHSGIWTPKPWRSPAFYPLDYGDIFILLHSVYKVR